MQEQPKLLFIFAHPDDESFIPAGTIARYSEEGAKIIHICATRGEGGRFVDTRSFPPDQLKMIRCRELDHACQVLGVKDHYILDYPDGHLHEIDPSEPVRRLAAFMRREKPDVIITFDQTGITHHLDHITIHHWVTGAFQFLNDPAYEAFGEDIHQAAKLYYLTVPSRHLVSISNSKRMKQYSDSKITTVINVKEYMDRKRKAIECHQSQCHTIQRVFQFAGGVDPLDDHEYYILAQCRIPNYAYEVVENDLLAGIRHRAKV